MVSAEGQGGPHRAAGSWQSSSGPALRCKSTETCFAGKLLRAPSWIWNPDMHLGISDLGFRACLRPKAALRCLVAKGGLAA